MSNHRRKKKQLSIYLDSWLKLIAENSALQHGKTLTQYIRELIMLDLGLEANYQPENIKITRLENGECICEMGNTCILIEADELLGVEGLG